MGATGSVGANEDTLARTRVAIGQLIEDEFDQADVIGSRVRSRVSRTQQLGHRFTSATVPVVDEGEQGMKSKPFLIGGFRVLLLTVGSDQEASMSMINGS